MPSLDDRAARLFYDDSCGPCRFAAHATEALSRHRVLALPLADPSADRTLGHLSSEDRFGYAHLAIGGVLRTGETIPVPLVGLTLGRRWERVFRQVPPLADSLRWAYLRLWEARRARGCGTRAPG